MWARPSRQYFGLLLLTLFAVLVHGYHLRTDDAAIYIPAIKKAFDPHLYPFGSEFFMEHGRLSIFSPLVAISAHLLHVPIDVAIFLWYILGIFLLLLAGWRIASLCFSSSRARCAAVALLAALLTVPIAGTPLVIADPYLTARSLSTPTTMFAIDSFMRGRRTATFLWIALTALVHPQMAVFALGFLVFLYWTTYKSPVATHTGLFGAATGAGLPDHLGDRAVASTERPVLPVSQRRGRSFPRGYGPSRNLIVLLRTSDI